MIFYDNNLTLIFYADAVLVQLQKRVRRLELYAVGNDTVYVQTYCIKKERKRTQIVLVPAWIRKGICDVQVSEALAAYVVLVPFSACWVGSSQP
jgi:hypothetical protein